MDPQPTIQLTTYKSSPRPMVSPGVEFMGLSDGAYSLLPGTDWYMVGGVAFRGKPCDNEFCENGEHKGDPGDVATWAGGSRPDTPLGKSICVSCRGWGVTPIDGEIRSVCTTHGNADWYPGEPYCEGLSSHPLTADEPCVSGRVLVLRLDGNGGT